MEMKGTIGPYRIGLNYTVRNRTELVTAHYFYFSKLNDIPLTGTVSGDSVVWKGMDGGVFRLRFTGNGSNGTAPLTFYNSIGLSGTWVLGSRTFPVKLVGTHDTANPGERFYADVTSASDSSVEQMARDAQSAIVGGDQLLAAKLVHFPLRVYKAKRHFTIGDSAELQKNWLQVFSPAFVARIQNESPHEMFVHDGAAMLGDGELWFDDKGITAVNDLP